ncbi:hypothetical protein [uncultured Campylobacter sp.]|uniref:hypothetical protein n=1 Tax=uncultured Campylobacter sp. TaxID=218934 RepID=UPI0026195E70|nr:hypothetical protein [uncultured Campylobacter sp.]
MKGSKIVLDEDKILREGKYNLAKVYQAIDRLARECNLVKKDKFTYLCKEDDELDFPHLGKFTHFGLMDQKWFMENLIEWTWLDSEEGDSNLIADYIELKEEGIFK